MTPARFRAIALGLSGASEGAHMGHADFRVAGRVFASLDRDERVASVHLPVAEQARFLADAPEACSPASGAWGRQGWTKIDLASADEELVGDAATAASHNARMLAMKTPPRKAAPASSITKRATVAKRATPAKAAKGLGTEAGVRAVDAYIAAAPAPVQPILQKIRSLVRRLAPTAEEVISYRMPAFKQDGMLIYYAPFKAHIGIFPPVQGDAALEADLAPYRGPKGNLRFPLDGKMPYALIARVVKARLADQRARAATRARR